MKSPKKDTYYFNLPNGIRLVHRQIDSPVSYVGIMVGVGSRDELPQEHGIAHFVEHCVFKGTEKRTARQIINRIEGVGGEVNAYTAKEETTFYATVPEQYTARAIELLSDIVFHPIFPEKELQKELQVITEELESYNDSPSDLIFDDFEELIFAGNSMAHAVLGNKKQIKFFTADKAKRFIQRTYRDDKIVVFTTCSLSFDKLKQIVVKYFSQEHFGKTDSSLRLPTAASANREATFRKHTHQAHVMLGGRAYQIGDEKQYALIYLNNILAGGSLNSRLNMSLREKRGLVYSVESTYTAYSDTGYWSVYFASDTQDRQLCVDLIMQELHRLKTEPLSDAVFRKYLVQLKGQMAVAAENKENNALNLGKQMLYLGQSPNWQQIYEKVALLTPTDILRVAQEVFADDNIYRLEYL